MAVKTRFLVIATVIATTLGAAAYFYLADGNAVGPPDGETLLQALPTAAVTDNVTAAQDWTQSRAIGRYDTMQRSGATVLGRWAGGIREACMGSAPITRIPDEKSWKQPVIVHQCFDGVPVFRIELIEN